MWMQGNKSIKIWQFSYAVLQFSNLCNFKTANNSSEIEILKARGEFHSSSFTSKLQW